ncbi:unnamed protein product [Durusdinium trenchii]|uniref:Uncharacterized protein n=1 Tax=Durusdinium trenchii TaxID=1381693 RepID=A0ABP0QRD0_9DINO
MPHLEITLGGARSSSSLFGGAQGALDEELGFQLDLEEEDGSISLTGKGLEISGGINLSEMFNDSQAWRLDLRMQELLATCEVDGRVSPCIGPCEELRLEFTFAPDRRVKWRELPDWPPRVMSEALEELEELPLVSLAVSSTSCPVRASIAQVTFFTKHGLSWGRWFSLREALSVQLDAAVPGTAQGAPEQGLASAYRRRWLRRLPQLLDVGVRPREQDLELGEERDPQGEADPQLVAFEAQTALRATLRERRLALLAPKAEEDGAGGLVFSSHRCMCSETHTSYDMLLRDPTARHSFFLMVSLACSEVELRGDSASLAVVPTDRRDGRLASGIVVQLGVHDAPDLKPLSLRLILHHCELQRRVGPTGAERGAPARHASERSERSERSLGLSSMTSSGLGVGGAVLHAEPPLIKVVGVASMLMDLTEPPDRRVAEPVPPRFCLDVGDAGAGGSKLQACFSYPMLLDILELIGQLQLELLEAVSEEEEVLERRLSEQRRSAARRSSLMYMPISLEEEGGIDEAETLALVRILKHISEAQLASGTAALEAPGSCPKDFRVNCVQAPLTLLVPCARAIDGAEDRVLGATLEGLLVLQFRLQCEHQPEGEEMSSGHQLVRTEPRESKFVSSKLILAEEISAWLLPDDLARELLQRSFADVETTQHLGRPLLLQCHKAVGRLLAEEELNLKMEMEDLIIHLSQSDAVLLSLLAQSLDSGPATAAGAGAGGDGTGSAGLWSDEGAEGARSRSSWEVKLKGISLRLLEGSEQKVSSLRVLARLDIGAQVLEMVSGEKVELLKYSLQQVMISDREEKKCLLRWYGDTESEPCAKLRYKGGDVSLALAKLDIIAYWQLFSDVLLCGCTMKNAIAARAAPASTRHGGDSSGGVQVAWTVRARLQQIMVYVPTFGEGHEDEAGLALCCGFQLAGGPLRHRPGHWKGRLQVSELSLVALDSVDSQGLPGEACLAARCASLCPPSEYQAENGSVRLDVSGAWSAEVGQVPVGYRNFELWLTSASSNRMHLWLLNETGHCLVGLPSCPVPVSETLRVPRRVDWGAGSFTRRAQVGVQEMLRIEEVLQAVQLRVSLERSSKSVSVGLLEYHHDATAAGSLPAAPRAKRRAARGGVDAPTCSSEPALPERLNGERVTRGVPVADRRSGGIGSD